MHKLETKLIDAAKEGKLLDVLSVLRLEEKVSYEELGDALIRVNNDHGIDVIGQFSELKNADGNHQFFDLRWLLEPALAKMNCPTEQVMRCVLHLTTEAGHDMTAGRLLEPFINYCSMSPERPEEALNLIAKDKDLLDLLSPALVAGSRLNLVSYHDRAVELAKDPDLEVRRRSIHSLGQLQYDDDTPCVEKSVAALRAAVVLETDDLLLGNTVKAIFNLYLLRNRLADELIGIVSKALETGADYALHAASELLAFNANDLPDEILPLLSKHLAKVPPSNGVTIRNIGFGINALAKLDDPIEGVKLLEESLKAYDGATEIDALGSVRTTIAESNGLLNKLATRWFTNGNPCLGRAIARIIEHEYSNTPDLAVDADELPFADFTHLFFVARKAVGFLFFYPVAAATFVLSLIELAPDSKTQCALTELLFDPLMLNYPGALEEAFEQRFFKESNDPATTASRAVSERFKAYVADIKSVGEVPEHHPPQSHQEFHSRNFHREMSKAMKEAQANSLLLSIVKKSVLLYGRKWIAYVDHPDEPASRMESDLQSVETSMDIPRMQNIDPLGLDYTLRVFRVEQLKT